MAYALIVVAYVIVGRLGLLLAVPPGYATAVFPSAGIGMAAMFIGGGATLPYVFIGSFVLNLWISHVIATPAVGLATAALIATASMLQAAVGGWGLRRLIGYPTTLDGGRDLTTFFLSVPILCLISASLSVIGVNALGVFAHEELRAGWTTWWLGDTLGVLLFLPLVMIVAGEPRGFWRRRVISVALPMLGLFALFIAIYMLVSTWDVTHQHWQSVVVLTSGVLSTSLIGGLLMLNAGERHRFVLSLAQSTRERDRIWRVCEDLLGVADFAGHFRNVNPAWTRTLGWTEDEIKQMHVSELRHPDDALTASKADASLTEGSPVRTETRFRHKDGTYRWIYWTMTAHEGLIYMAGRNVTADKEAAKLLRDTEAQLHQLQKIKLIGQLTGGIAHDFNNLLTVIIGNLDHLRRFHPPVSIKAYQDIDLAMRAAMQGATLTRRLLAYAQDQPLRPRPVALNKLVTGMTTLIRRTHGEAIDYVFDLGDDLPLCFCDPNQAETAILNLAINACEAMPDGGKLTIHTSTVVLDGAGANDRGIAAGAYVVLTITDTGLGMMRETVERACEPFFTTKAQGTGLGLSMVDEFVKQSKGHLEIDSVLGHGTTVRIFLPRLAEGAAPADVAPITVGARETGEVVLVAEDDVGVRGFVMEALRELGYVAIETADGRAALDVVAASEIQLDLLLTDMVMPCLSGRKLVQQALVMRPNLKVLFMTGYSEDAQGIEVLQKPFHITALASRVRAVLDSQRL